MVAVVPVRGEASSPNSLGGPKLIKLFPIAPKDSSPDIVSWPFCVAREGDLFLLAPEKKPLIVDAVPDPEEWDLIVVA